MEDIYKICFYGGLVLAILLLIVSIVLFVVLKIPKVIGELTGSTARKSINEMRSGVHSSSESARKEQGKYYNQGSGKIKVRETVSVEKRKENRDDTTDFLDNKKKRLRFETVDASRFSAATESIDEEETTLLAREQDEEETTLLAREQDEEETTLLAGEQDEEKTTVLAGEQDEEETMVLAGGQDETETTLLAGGQDETETTLLARENEEATDVLRDENSEGGDGTMVLAAPEATDKGARKVKVQYNVVVTHTDESL